MKHFTLQSMYEIRRDLKHQLLVAPLAPLCFEVLNPDLHNNCYAGEIVCHNGIEYIYRGYKAWVDLAQSLMCKMLTPEKKSSHTIILKFVSLSEKKSFHSHKEQIQERYGKESIFSKINKNEEPAFLDAFICALDFIAFDTQSNRPLRILNLGINRGLEFELIQQHIDTRNIKFVGIDYCNSAIQEAKQRFANDENFQFIACDINRLDELHLEKFDCIMSIGTFQSSTLEFKPLFMKLVQNYLKKEGSMILGFPNCKWFDGEMIYGARVPNYRNSELTRLFKDLYFCKKYLQQKKFKVMVNGKEYVFLSAKPIKIKSTLDKIDSI